MTYSNFTYIPVKVKFCHLSQMPIFISLYIKLKELSNAFQKNKIKKIDMVYITVMGLRFCAYIHLAQSLYLNLSFVTFWFSF